MIYYGGITITGAWAIVRAPLRQTTALWLRGCRLRKGVPVLSGKGRQVARWAVVHCDRYNINRIMFENVNFDLCELQADHIWEHDAMRGDIVSVVVAEFADGASGYTTPPPN